MRVLIVDDDSAKHAFYAKAYREHEVTHTYSYYQACDALDQQERFDIVQLDHDLGDFREPDRLVEAYGSIELTGYHVAHHIALEIPFGKRPDRIIVHSVNPSGASSIVAILERYGIHPDVEPFILR